MEELSLKYTLELKKDEFIYGILMLALKMSMYLLQENHDIFNNIFRPWG